MENKSLPRTVLRSFLHKLERNLMQGLELQCRINYLTSYPLEPVNKPVTPNSCLYSDPRLYNKVGNS